MEKSFVCDWCKKTVSSESCGVLNRNHCPYCLYSKHVDLSYPGDRKSRCFGEMEAIGLTFKKAG